MHPDDVTHRSAAGREPPARERAPRAEAEPRGFWTTAAAAVAFALAMAYLESAVVVYLSGALGGRVGEIFPIRYGWLVVFTGWPGSPATTDLLFLLPVPWVGPVWSPVVVSLALVGFGLAAARRLRAGGRVVLQPWHAVAGVVGGALVVLSWTLDFRRVLDGGLPGPYPWPVFAAGMAVATAAAIDALSERRPARPPASAGTASPS